MLKSRVAAKALENIVGGENFSEDPAIISSYTMQPPIGEAAKGEFFKDFFDSLKLGGVILPGSTEEVQAIVKVCNRYKICFKAHCTGMGLFSLPQPEGSIAVDLRRMNQLVIDAENMYAIMEPYVSHGELAAEAMKHGLTCNMIGAGSQCSMLASTTSLMGVGHTVYTTASNARNCLGEEWVLPTGEVVRWGLVEEGKVGPPGPGYRGLCRGFFGVRGDLGIFTKCAVKLSPWPGPRELEITGRNPTPGIRIPKNMKAYHFALPGLGKFTEAAYKLADAAIAYHIWYFPLYYHLARWGGESNDDHYEGWKKFEAAGIIDRYKEEITIVIGAYSEKELKFKVEVLKDIMDETGAEELKLPGFTEHEAERFFCAQICAHKPCTQFRVGRGGQGSSWFQYLSLDGHVKGKKGIRQLYRKYVDKGAFNDYGMDTMWAGPEEGRSWGHSEYIAHTDQMKPELASELLNWTGETVSLAINERVLGTGLSSSAYHKYEPGEVEEKYLDNPAPYKVKIKKALDPNNVGDEISFYSDVRSKYRE